MNVTMRPMGFSQSIANTNFRSKQEAMNVAVDLMAEVRTSYAGWNPESIKRIMFRMKTQLQTVLQYQRHGGETIFGESEIAAVRGRINSLYKMCKNV